MRKLFFLAILLIAGVANAQSYDWAFSVGGVSGDDFGNSISTDTSGNVYVTGYFEIIADFDPGPGIANLTSNGFGDLFVAKYDSAGNYLWAFKIGGTVGDRGYSIAIDSAGSGDICVTGYFSGTADFDPSPGIANLTSNALLDFFVAKYDANGNYLWAFNVGGTNGNVGYGIAFNPSGNGDVYVTGRFAGTADFDPSLNTANLTANNNGSDLFIAKYDSGGNYLWAFNVGGASTEFGYGISIDVSGNVHVTGYFRDIADFDPGPGIVNLTSNGWDDIFIAKYDTDGNYLWAFSFGGTNGDQGKSIAIDLAGSCEVYVTGYFSGTADFDPGPGIVNLTSTSGSEDMFVAKYDSAGNYIWAFNAGGGWVDRGFSISTDMAGSGDVYVTGDFRYTVDFDPSLDTANLTSNGGSDIFIAKYDSAGNYIWAFNAGGAGSDCGYSINGPSESGDIYITGTFRNTADFDPSQFTANLTSNGNNDFFVAKYDTVCLFVTATASSDTTICMGDSVTLTASGGTNYIWNPSNGLSDTTVASPVASPISTTTYSVIVSTACTSDTAYVIITVNPSYSINDTSISICNGDSTLIYGNYETTTGTYYDSLTTIIGCDSVHFVILTVNPVYSMNPSMNICEGDSALLGGGWQITAGIYNDSLQTISGCDSILATTLTLNTVDTSVILIGTLLTANAIGTTYQWIDCDNAFTPIGGATGQSFTPGANGNYAVIVTQNGCTDTSSCYTVTGVGLSEISQINNITIHPNPTSYSFTISGKYELPAVLKLYDITGRQIYQQLLTSNKQPVNVNHLAKGLYVWQLGTVRGKLIVE